MLPLALFLVLAAYPFLVYLGLQRLGPLALAGLLGLLLLLRLHYTGQLRAGARGVAIIAAIAVFVGAVGLSGDPRWLKSYPVLISLVLLVAFAASLVRPPTLIERGLRAAGREVPPEAGPYLKWVTFAWCVFFAFNATVAGWTAVAAPLETWAWYNGFLSYVLIACLFAVEWCIRGIYRRRVGARD